MVPLTALVVPILLSAVIVFLVSSVIHMALRYHRSDMQKVAKEDELMAALRPFAVPPGDYAVPCAGSPEIMRTPEFVAKMAKGPVILMSVAPAGPPALTKNLVQWFLFAVVVGIFTAYVSGLALPPGADYRQVFRIAGTTAFIGYALALAHDSIWYYRSWATTGKFMFDGFVYALMTGGTFGWLWP
jgi:hypothetical protein